MDVPAFVATQLRLLQLERDAEAAEAERLLHDRSDAELIAAGVCLLRLVVADLEPGLGGRLHAVLRSSRGDELPAHRFGPGDLTALREARGAPPLASGVVVRANRQQLVVALDDEDVDLPSLVRIDRLASDVTWRRLEAAVRGLARERRGDEARYVDTLFGDREVVLAAPRGEPTWFDAALDPSQRDAVATALRAEHVALIHGPPGTGKTTAVVEFIRQVVARGERVLACAPSNVAVDNLAERLLRAGLDVVRLGHPARVQAAVRDVSLSALVDQSPDQKLLRDVRRELSEGQRALHKAKTRQDRAAAREALRRLRGEQRQLEQAITRGFVGKAQVVLATLTGAADPLLLEVPFDQVVIDEAAQALEASCWIALPRAKRALLAGDHRQLPPTIQSAEAAVQGLARTLFERLADAATIAPAVRMLTVQYRMHAAIMGWPAARFYGGRLTAADAVRGHLLTDLPGVMPNEWTSEPLCFVDTAGCGHEETAGDEDGSKANPGEADLVVRIVGELRDAGVPDAAIAIVTPYNAQVQLLRERFGSSELEIGTVDGLQGREKEAVVVSLVRSNERGETGFLTELRRLNVALTRARRHLTIVGDSATLAGDRDLCQLVEHLQAHAHYRSAFELA